MAYSQHEQRDHADEHRAASSMLQQRGWALLDAATLAARAAQLRADVPGVTPADAVLHCYAQALHDACAGQHGAEQQRRAFGELHRYVYDVARRVAPELACDEWAEVADQTVAALYERVSGAAHSPVHVPGAFLAVAVQQVRNSVRRWRSSTPLHLDGMESVAAAQNGEPEQHAVRRELQQRVQRCFVRSLQAHPRARLQLRVVWMRQVLGLGYAAIGAQLARTPNNIRVLHTRGLHVLRADPAWRELGIEQGVIAVPDPAWHQHAGEKGSSGYEQAPAFRAAQSGAAA